MRSSWKRWLACLSIAALSVTLAGAEPSVAAGPGPMLDEPRWLLAEGPPARAAAAPRSLEELQARIAAVLEREGVPGVGLALVDAEGIRWAGGVGVADLETMRPVDADTVFRVGSITKSVVALGVSRLVEQGRLDLGRPLAALMPEVEFENPWPEAPITLAHALEHTTGFDDMRFREWWGPEDMRPRDALALHPPSRVARWRPGSRVSYSNPGYTIAGHAIELATGEDYASWLEREVLAPLGMRSARFRRDALAGRLATGYVGPERAASFRPIAHAPAGALLASPRELAELVRFWLRRDGGGIVSPAALDRIERTATLPYAATDASYGLGNYGDVMHPARARGHDGGLPGFLSCYRYFPELGVGYVMLLNATHSVRAYLEIRALLFAYLARGAAPPEPPRAAPDPAAIAAATGYYGYENPRIELFAFLERAVLGVSVRGAGEGIELELLSGGVIPMVPTGDQGYRHPLESGTSVRLATDLEGGRIVSAGFAYFEAGSFASARARLGALQGALLLLQLAPLWGLGWALWAGVRRVKGRSPAPGEAGLHLWPAAAALFFFGIAVLFTEVFERDAFASANPWSVGLCACTIAFAFASAAALAAAVRAASARVGSWPARLLPSAAALACFGMALYLLRHGIIGLRIWAW